MEQQANIDIDQLSSSVRSRLLHNSPMSASCCIFRVPSPLRKHDEKLFTPTLVPIGPYHRDPEKFQFAEKIKLWYLNCLINRAPTAHTTLECFFTKIAANVNHCLECYGDEVKMERDEFVEMLAIDGCFIIELFRRFLKIIPTSAYDPLLKMPWVRIVLVTDLLLLENQLPWFVLDCLFNLTKSDNDSERGTFPQVAQEYFRWDILRTPGVQVDLKLQNKHLLDLQRNIMLLGSEELEDGDFVPIPRVTELLQAGIDFAVGEKHNFMKITFKKGILTIPPIIILDNAESLLRNLIAYEQCDENLQDRIAAYAGFLDNLIDTNEDIDYLRQKGIVTCFLSPEDVSGFFNRLYNDVHIVHSPFTKVSKEINAYCKSRWPRWRTRLTRDYFNSPWSIISLIGALTILVLTFLQTLYAMLYH
ncbi:conserved hypothetical protein [Ricinus communis]|uniref:Uncharacterized protein n=1 Tax=Ricinus communis TaxID=3988 RepID=B9S823_RICCO|nr:conserved hypothetical protein [Ricinus communis]|eukprot:XP_002522139.1 UPF0481 protein At3g47200 [Ricinus communis]